MTIKPTIIELLQKAIDDQQLLMWTDELEQGQFDTFHAFEAFGRVILLNETEQDVYDRTFYVWNPITLKLDEVTSLEDEILRAYDDEHSLREQDYLVYIKGVEGKE